MSEGAEGNDDVPTPGTTYESWEEAKEKLDDYAKRNHFQWTTGTSTSVANENKNLQARGSTDFYKDELIHKNIILTCVSGGKKRINQGKGDRVYQGTWKVDCPVKVHLIANKTSLKVVALTSEHENHKCDLNYFKSLPQTRRSNLASEKTQNTVKLLLKGKLKPSTIRCLLRDEGDCGEVTAKDLANLRTKWKKEGRNGRTPEEMLGATLENLLEADPGAEIRVGKTAEGNDLEFLFIQTSSMKKTMKDFGQVLLLDHTYKINKNKMPVTVFMTMDGHGDGRAVGYAFVANELSSTIANVINTFKESIGEDCANSIRTVIIDKDYSEVKAIKTVLPNVNTQLCDFHVSRTFKSKSKKEDREVRTIIDNMRYCGDEAEFEELTQKLEAVASEEFFKYFEANWLNCELAWSFRDKKKSANLGNNTNNRLENHNSKIKMMLDCNNELWEAIENLIKLVKNKEEDVIFRDAVESAKEFYYTKNPDPVIKCILNDLTKFSAKLIIWKLQQTVTKAEVTKYGSSIKECKCPHWCSYYLPCRHIFHCRRISGHPLYCKEGIDSRWFQNFESNLCEDTTGADSNIPNNVVTCQVMPSKQVPKTGDDRYTQSMVLLRKIGTIMSECGTRQYSQRYAVLQSIYELWAAGKEGVFLEIVDTFDTQEPIATDAENAASSTTHSGDNATENACLSPSSGATILPETPGLSSLVSSAPMCKCALTCERTVSNLNHKMPGRAFYVCPLSKCGFRRFAPKEFSGTKSNPTIETDEAPIADVPKTNNNERDFTIGANENLKSAENFNSSNNEAESNLAMLVAELESSEWDDTDFGDKIETGTSQGQISDVLKGIKLPLAVKHKGRPQGLGKTTSSWTKNRPSGAILKSSAPIDEEEARKARGKAIKDADVKHDKENDRWHVTSQDKKSLKVYTVTPTGPSEDPKSWSCDCEDYIRRHITCKHVYKVMSIAAKCQDSSLRIHRLSVTPSFDEKSSKRRKIDSNEEGRPEEDGFIVVPNTDRTKNVTVRKQRKEGPPPMCHCGDPSQLRRTPEGRLFYGCWKFQCSNVQSLVECQVPAQPKATGDPQVIEISSDSDEEAAAAPVTEMKIEKVDSKCLICEQDGPPSKEGAHKCAECKRPVHAFGCSVPRGEGNEGYGGNDLLCLQCSTKSQEDPLLNEILMELNTGRPQWNKILPARLRRSYVFDS